METKFYIGLDVHCKSTDYAVRSWQGDIVQEGTCASIYKDLKGALEPYYHSCVVGMEATTAFYPLYDEFRHDQVQVKIANVLRLRQLVVKNDRLDALRLSDMLRLNTFPESYIPGKEIQALRDLVKLRHSFLEENTEAKARIWALLTRRGVRFPVKKIFSKKGLVLLEALTSKDDCPFDLKHLYLHYKNLDISLQKFTNEMENYATKTYPAECGILQELDGVGPTIASYLIAEICPISRFASEKKLRRYAGVIPCFHESAGKCYGGSLPKSSSRPLLRWALTQGAHGAIRTKNSTLRGYYESKKQKGKQKAIMAVARSLCDKVFQSLNNHP